MKNSFLKLISDILSLKSITSWFIFFTIIITLFGFSWTFVNASGISGSPYVFMIIMISSIIISCFLLFLRLFRWTLIYWAIGKNIDSIITYDPSVIIGLGYGGGIVSAMLSKRITEKTKKEPTYYVIDRKIVQKGKYREVEIGDINKSTANIIINRKLKVLLVAAETHTGATLSLASNYLDSLGIEHKTYVLCYSPRSKITVDYFILCTHSRALIPWPHAPVDQVDISDDRI